MHRASRRGYCNSNLRFASVVRRVALEANATMELHRGGARCGSELRSVTCRTRTAVKHPLPLAGPLPPDGVSPLPATITCMETVCLPPLQGGLVVAAVIAVASLAGCSTPPPSAEVGECVDIAVNSTSVTEFTGFDCAMEHDIEVYFVGDVAATDFDAIAIAEEASALCRAEFETFVGLTYEESTLDIYYLYPQQESWDAGDREVICAVYTPDPETNGVIRTTGSLRDARV